MIESLERIEKTREYLDYIEEHILNVQKAWEIIKEKCKDMRFIYDDLFYHTLNKHIEFHDLSKLSIKEFVQYRKVFFPTENEPKANLSKAWEHHKNQNEHHWENWTTILPCVHPCDWEIHCVHMVIDWMAMGMKFGDTAQAYYEKNKNKIKLPDDAVDFIYEIFKRVYTK